MDQESSSPDDLEGRFTEALAMHTALAKETEYALKKLITDAEIKVHSITSRVKSWKSFHKKASIKNYTDPLSETTDIVGARVVCLFIEDRAKVESIIRTNFDVLKYDDKEKTSDPDTWKYTSVHFDCRLKETHEGPRYDWLKGLTFEVQVRTILQDAWATVQHYLAYKGESSIPEQLKRDFSALAGLFHIADKSFQQIHDTSQRLDQEADSKVRHLAETLSQHQRQEPISALADVTLDRSTMKAILRATFPDRRPGSDKGYSELVEQLAAIKVVSVAGLQKLLNAGVAVAEHIESENPPHDMKGKETRFSDVGITRMAINVAYPDFVLHEKRDREYFKNQKRAYLAGLAEDFSTDDDE